MNITKYKKQNTVEHKTDKNNTKYKKLNMIEHKTNMKITEKLSSNSMKKHYTEHNYTLVNQTIKI